MSVVIVNDDNIITERNDNVSVGTFFGSHEDTEESESFLRVV